MSITWKEFYLKDVMKVNLLEVLEQKWNLNYQQKVLNSFVHSLKN